MNYRELSPDITFKSNILHYFSVLSKSVRSCHLTACIKLRWLHETINFCEAVICQCICNQSLKKYSLSMSFWIHCIPSFHVMISIFMIHLFCPARRRVSQRRTSSSCGRWMGPTLQTAKPFSFFERGSSLLRNDSEPCLISEFSLILDI